MSGLKRFVWLSLVAVAVGAPSVSDAAFLPSDVPGLQLWLDAGFGVTVDGAGYNAGNVGAWADRTGGSNTSAESAQVNGANPGPTLLPTGLGGQPALSFTPATFTRLENINDNLVAPGGARSVIVVGDAADSGTPGPMFTFRRSSPEFVDRFVPFGGELYVYEENLANPAYIDDSNLTTVRAPFVSYLASSGTGGSLTVNINGEDKPVTTPGIGTDSGDPGFTVGAIALNSQTWNGLISEVLVYDHVLTDDELNAVGYYLGAKYGVETTFVVPEPASLTLVGLAGLALARRRAVRCGPQFS